MSEVSDKTMERGVMSANAEAAMLLRQIAGSGEPGETKKAAWLRAYRRLRGEWTFNRVKDLWRQEPRAKVSADELNQLRQAAGSTAGAQRGLAERVEQLAAQIRALEARFPQDEAFYRVQADQLRDIARQVGSVDPS